MQLVDILALYWLGIKIIVFFVSIVTLVSSFDDFIIDVLYWLRFTFRKIVIRPRHPRIFVEELYNAEQKPIAIMSPAWDEPAVIGKMVQRCIREFDYDNFHIFIGTYPNDPATQAAVDEVVELFPNVHKVVGVKDGPTTKAECLNNVIRNIFQYEKENGIEFNTICYHDAEDVIHPLELRLYNYLIPRKDMIQIPVLPFPRRWFDFIGNHYMDEFAEIHGKDMKVREAFGGHIPSCGVATAFSRRAFEHLSNENDGVVFDESTLTEDYNIGFSLKRAGMKQAFVTVPLKYKKENEQRFGSMNKVICSGGYFPNKFYQSFRQKARWTTGIVFQGLEKLGWPRDLRHFYFLFHDRKGMVTNFVPFVGYFVVLNVLIMEVATGINDDAWWFPSLIPDRSLLWHLLMINGFFLINRIAQRAYFVTRFYGIKHGILSVPRALVSNTVNFFALARAIFLMRQAKKAGQQVKWDKTEHEDEGAHD